MQSINQVKYFKQNAQLLNNQVKYFAKSTEQTSKIVASYKWDHNFAMSRPANKHDQELTYPKL